MWRLASLTLLVSLAGCHAPMPSMNDIAPSSTSRVPPPSTGSYGSANQNQYYPATAPPPAGPLPGVSVGVRPTAAFTAVPPDSTTGTVPTQQGQPAAFAAPSGSTAGASPPVYGAVSPRSLNPDDLISTSSTGESQVRIVEQPATSGSLPALQGMPVHDASREPAPFQPQGQLLEISQLPASSSFTASPVGTGVAPSPIPPGTPAGIPSGTHAGSGQPVPGRTAGAATLNWQNP